jgi:hypothetical protein
LRRRLSSDARILTTPQAFRKGMAATRGTTMADLLAEVETEEPPADEPPPIPHGRPSEEGQM